MTNPRSTTSALIVVLVTATLNAAAQPARPNIFGGLSSSNYGSESFWKDASRYGLLLVSHSPGPLDRLRELNPRIRLIHTVNPYFANGPLLTANFFDPQKIRPGWVLRDQSGGVIRFSGPLFAGWSEDNRPAMLDLRNAEYQDYFLQNVVNSTQTLTLDGVFLDTWTAGIPPWAMGPRKTPPKGYNAEDYQRTMHSLQDRLNQRLGDKLILVNSFTVPPGGEDWGGIEFVRKADGTATKAYGIFMRMDVDDAVKHWFFHDTVMRLMSAARRMNKIFMLSTAGSEKDVDNRIFALASFLLLQWEDSYFSYDAGLNGSGAWFPEWDVPLGKPLGRFIETDGVYRREFEHGVVLVNPTPAPSAVQLDSAYRDHQNEQVAQTLHLSAYGGAILRK